VPVLQAPPLARALYAHTEVDAGDPGALFAAVAQVLAWVYQLRARWPPGAAAPCRRRCPSRVPPNWTRTTRRPAAPPPRAEHERAAARLQALVRPARGAAGADCCRSSSC
jgi:hypothetical protein